MEALQKVMQQKLDKDLTAMKRDVWKEWPEEDPEILLLNWLCDRQGFKRPKPKPKLPIGVEDYQPPSTASRPSVRTFRDPSTLSTFKQEIVEARSKTPLPSPRVKLRNERLLNDKLASIEDASARATAMAGHCVEEDAWRFEESQQIMATGDKRVQGTIANLRTELRGKFISRVPLLVADTLSDSDRYWLVGKLRPWNFKEGEIIVEEGDVGDKLYIIERGFCEVIVSGITRGVIGREDFFGELAVMYASPRTATVRAKTEVTLLSLSRDDLNATVSQEKVAELAVVARARLFTGVPLLSALGAKRKEFVTRSLKMETWKPETVLARQGNVLSGDTRRMYIILDGRCKKEVLPSSFHEEEVGVDTMRHGSFFNMFAMWYGCPCGATVTTETAATTLSLAHDELMAISVGEIKEAKRTNMSNQKLQKPETECLSETLNSIRHAMWLHLLKTFFLKMGMDDVANNNSALVVVCEQSKEIAFKKWDPVFTKGIPYDTVYILETGALSEHESDIETLRDEHELGQRAGCIQHSIPGTSFGALCLQGKERNVPTSTLAASSDCTMLSIPGDVFRRLLRNGLT